MSINREFSGSSRCVIRLVILVSTLVCILYFCGCATFSGKDRGNDALEYHRSIAALTKEGLSSKDVFGLIDCVEIAQKNNLEVKMSEIQAKLRTLEKKASFADFLPTIELNAGLAIWDHQPMVKAGEGLYRATHDRELRELVIKAQMPIFAPSTWYLYSMQKRGGKIIGLLKEYTRQMITLQVSALYYQCLMLQETEKALGSQVTAAETLEAHMSALYDEGMVSKWQVEQVEALLLSHRMDLNYTQRSIRKAKADLLGAMGLSPMAEIKLMGKLPLEVPDGTLEDLVLQALLENPQIHIADQMVEIEKDRARMVIASFLPSLVGFASFSHTSDSFTFDTDYWKSGLSGILTIFNGFKNIYAYKAVRQKEKEAMLEREDACLSIILQVIKAYLNLEDTEGALKLAQKSLQIADSRRAEIEAKWEEGLVEPAERLNAIAEVERAMMDVINARFSRQVSIATLLNVMGKGYLEKGKESMENASTMDMSIGSPGPALLKYKLEKGYINRLTR